MSSEGTHVCICGQYPHTEACANRPESESREATVTEAARVELCYHGRKIACPECVDEGPAEEYMLRAEVIRLTKRVKEVDAQARRAGFEAGEVSGRRLGLHEVLEMLAPFVECKCRSDHYGADSRIVGQEHWGGCHARLYWAIRALIPAPASEEGKK